MTPRRIDRIPRIVLSGGPGGGKTTAADLLRRELGDCLVIVPEAATMLFSGGYPRYAQTDAVKALQRAIYHVQRGLEYSHGARYPQRVLLCDRGTIDGAAHWPDGPDAFFAELGTSLDRELDRYDAVLFFETAAVGNISIEGGNPARIETLGEARQLDHKLRVLWEKHPRFLLLPHRKSFLDKVSEGVRITERLIEDLIDGVG